MKRRPKAPPRPQSRPPIDKPPAAKSAIGSALNYGTYAILAAVFILGVGLGIAFSSTANFSPQNVASREFIDSSAPNAELCVQYGASAVTMDMRAFMTLNPFNVYVSQPTMQPGCVLRSNNWAVLERENLVSQQQVRECKNRMNTFGFTGDIEGKGLAPKIDCIYQNDGARNLFLNQPGGGAPPPETQRF
jgi:Protein of unknown function (DUF3172)